MEAYDLIEMLGPRRDFVDRVETMIVEGQPISWKRPRQNGKTRYTDPRVKSWQESISYQIRSQWRGEPTTGLCCLDIVACLPRPRSHFNREGVRDTAPFFSGSLRGGDSDNHRKAVQDALNGILYRDDALVVSGSDHKVYADNRAGDLPRHGDSICCGVIIRFSTVSDEAPAWMGRGLGLSG